MVRRRHTHVGAPDNRIEALYKEYVLTPRGKRHEPGTWTRGRRLTGKKAIISLSLEQRDFLLVRPRNLEHSGHGVKKEGLYDGFLRLW
jgi:hypothetical protein